MFSFGKKKKEAPPPPHKDATKLPPPPPSSSTSYSSPYPSSSNEPSAAYCSSSMGTSTYSYSSTSSTTAGSTHGGRTTATGMSGEGAIERRELPMIVKEFVQPSRREEVQPVIERSIEKTEIHHVIQPINERIVEEPKTETHVLEKQIRAVEGYKGGEMVAELEAAHQREHSTKEIRAPTYERIEKQPIIHEVVCRKVIEEIQPVINREVIAPTVIQTTLPIQEKVIEKPVVICETKPVQEKKMMSGGEKMTSKGVQATEGRGEPIPMTTTSTVRGEGITNAPTIHIHKVDTVHEPMMREKTHGPLPHQYASKTTSEEGYSQQRY